MGLIVVEGDLLKSDCTMIMHQANCFAKMGAGIAKTIATKYPEVARADREFEVGIGELDRLGRCSSAFVTNIDTGAPMLITNVYGQYAWARQGENIVQTDYNALSWGLVRAIIQNKEHTKKVGVPYYMGCGLAGGDWETVSHILEDLSVYAGGNIYAYKLR